MKNQPFSTVVLVSSGIAGLATLIITLSLCYGGQHFSYMGGLTGFLTFLLYLFIAWIPFIALPALASQAHFSKLSNWVLSICAVFMAVAELLALGSLAFGSSHEMAGLALLYIFGLEFVLLVSMLFLVLVAEGLNSLYRKLRNRGV